MSKYSLSIPTILPSSLTKTPILNSCREDEIAEWLKINPQVTNFVVLDDRFLDSEIIREHFVKTSGYSKGLDETSVDKAIEILNS